MRIREVELIVPMKLADGNVLAKLESAVLGQLPTSSWPLRVALTGSDREKVRATVSVLEGIEEASVVSAESIFRFHRRSMENVEKFNVALVVPTGIGAEIGGHAGDATPVARLIGEACDTVILHPNVVNASDINEMPGNALYVEGSILARVLMGTVGLAAVRANRILVVVDSHHDRLFIDSTVNAVGAARASLGIACATVVELNPGINMKTYYTEIGSAAGEIGGLEQLCKVLYEYRGKYDAVAISSVIDVPTEYHQQYFASGGEMVNPWGGVEAMLTHAISGSFNIPSAHSPMFEDREVANIETGVVEPRMAAEAISLTFLQSILKGMHKSPRVVTDRAQFASSGIVSASNVSCLVIPDGCIGLPTLAALEQGIPVIAVEENRNVMENDLTLLPWEAGQLHVVRNYWEAVGVLCAIRGGIAPEAVRRPLAATTIVGQTAGGSEGGQTTAGRDGIVEKPTYLFC